MTCMLLFRISSRSSPRSTAFNPIALDAADVVDAAELADASGAALAPSLPGVGRAEAFDVSSLIAAGQDVNARGGRRKVTPAHMAAAGRHGEALKLLLDAGADVNAVSKYVYWNGRFWDEVCVSVYVCERE